MKPKCYSLKTIEFDMEQVEHDQLQKNKLKKTISLPDHQFA